MSTQRTTRLDIPVVLPDVQDAKDECIKRLVAILEGRPGVLRVHIVGPEDERPDGQSTAGLQLCLHYDAEQLSLGQLNALVRATGAELAERYEHVVLPLRVVGAEDDGQRLEQTLRSLPGVTAAVVNLPAQLARVEFDRTVVDLDTIRVAVRPSAAAASPQSDGPPGSPPVGAAPASSWYSRNRELAWSLFAGLMLGVGMLVRHYGPARPAILFFAAAYVFGARDNVGHLLAGIRRGRLALNIDLLMVVAALGAAALGQWAEGALLLFLFSLGHALEHYALGRARHAISALAELAPQTATVLRRTGGTATEVTVPIAQVRAGDHVVVKPGERISVDGAVIEGRSAVNQAPITGESVPVEKQPGDLVYAASVNGEGALVVQVTAAVGDRTLDRVIRLVAEAQTQKAPTQQLTDRFERVFVPCVLAFDLLLMIGPPLMGIWTWSEAFYRAMAMLVAASPCALALGTPAAVLAGIAQAARNGVLIKGGAHLEMLGTINTLAMDKTGTLTTGEPAVVDVLPVKECDGDRLLTAAAAAEQRSQHPLARAVLKAATSRHLDLPPSSEVEAITGAGLRAKVGGDMIEVGRLSMFTNVPGGVPPSIRADVERLEAAGRSTVVVRRFQSSGPQAGFLGVLGIADPPRPGAVETLTALRGAGVGRIVMLTGDNAGAGNAAAASVGITEVHAGLMPADKVESITALAREGRVAMVGDGVNDAPALAHAHVGIAMGGAGTAAAMETADVVLMGDDLARLPFAILLSRRARRVIRQNLVLALVVIAVLVAATISGLARIGPVVVVHEGSTLAVVANALRLLQFSAPRPGASS